MKATSSHSDRKLRIREIAHSIWESEGRPAGQEVRHWLMAEKLVLAEERQASHRGEESKKRKN